MLEVVIRKTLKINLKKFVIAFWLTMGLLKAFLDFLFKSIASFCLILHNQPSVSHNQVCLSCLINKSFKGCLVFFFLITHHSSLNFHHSSLITHHLKYPNSLNPTHLAPITQLCFQQKKPKKLGPTH